MGGNCVVLEGRERSRGEEWFRGNIRELDGVWVCPCCGVVEREKGRGRGKWRRCVDVLDVEKFE